MRTRTIRDGLTFSAQCRELGASIKRLDEVLRGATWALALNAEAFPDVTGTGIRVLHVKRFPGIPRLRIFFKIADDDYIDLMWIEEIGEDPTEPVL